MVASKLFPSLRYFFQVSPCEFQIIYVHTFTEIIASFSVVLTTSASYLNAPRDVTVNITPNNNQISINFTINSNNSSNTTTSLDLKSLSVKDQNGDEIFYAILSNGIVEIRNNSRYGNRVNVVKKSGNDNGYTLVIRNMTIADEGEIIGHVLYEQTDDVDIVKYFVEQTVVHITVQGQRSLFYFIIVFHLNVAGYLIALDVKTDNFLIKNCQNNLCTEFVYTFSFSKNIFGIDNFLNSIALFQFRFCIPFCSIISQYVEPFLNSL